MGKTDEAEGKGLVTGAFPLEKKRMECYHYQVNVTTKHCGHRLPNFYDCIDILTCEVRKTLTNEIRPQAPLVCLMEQPQLI